MVADREAPVRLAEVAVKGAPANQRPSFLNTLGSALTAPDGSRSRFVVLKRVSRSAVARALPQDWVFLALAHHQLGHRAEALRWLDRFRTYQANEKPDAFWNELEIRLLRQEAEARILFDPVFPHDPFAH